MTTFKKIFAAALLFLFAFSCSAYALDSSIEAMAEDYGLIEEGPVERIRLGIMSFTSKTYDLPNSKAAAISDFFGRLLFKADDIMLVERERLDDIAQELRLGMSGLVDPKTAAEIGKIAGAEYMLLGSVTNLERKRSAGTIPLWYVAVSVNEETVKVDLDIRVVKVETGEIVYADAASGTAKQSSTGLATAYFGIANSEFDGIEGNAIFNATAQLAPKIQTAMTGRTTLKAILEEEFKKAVKGKKGKKAEKEEKATVAKKRRKSKEEREAEAAERAAERAEREAEAEAAATPSAPEPEAEVEVATEAPAPSPKVGVSSVGVSSVSPSTHHEYENHSTDPAEVIKTYDLPAGEKNIRRVAHINMRQYGNRKKAYDEYVKLYESFNGDYLAAFKAGEVALALRDRENAKFWYDKALEINPDYEPAQKAKARLESAPKKSSGKRRGRK